MTDDYEPRVTPGFYNANDYVCVRLTDHGRAVLKRNHDGLFSRWPEWKRAEYRPKEEWEGWSEWQVHDLMSELGPGIPAASMPVPFETWFFVGSLDQLKERIAKAEHT